MALAQIATDEACCGRLIHRRLPAGLKKHRRKETKMKTIEAGELSTMHDASKDHYSACYNKSGTYEAHCIARIRYVHEHERDES